MRLHLDNGSAEYARAVIERFPEDNCMVFVYSRALIELISLTLKEDGSSNDLVTDTMRKGQLLWIVAFFMIYYLLIIDHMYSYES